MSPDVTSFDEYNANYLQRFLAWATPLAFVFAAMFGLTYALERTILMGVLGLATLVTACMLLVARSWVRQGATKQAVVLICTSLLMIDILAALIQPISWLGELILPLLVAAVALPYLFGRWLYWMLCLCWLTGALVAVLSEIVPPPIIQPHELGSALRVMLVLGPLSITLLLLWQFSSRLSRTLEDLRSTNMALRESELRYRRISEVTADVIYSVLIDPAKEPRLEWASESFAKTMGGYSVEELRSHETWLSVVHPDDRAIEEQHGVAVLAGRADVIEYRIITKSGEIRWLRDHARPEWDNAQARVVRILAAATDITERKRAEESLHQSRTLLQLVADVVPVLLAYVDTQRRYRFVNRGYLLWYGLSEAEIIGREMREVLGEPLFTSVEHYVEAALAGETAIFEATPFDRTRTAHRVQVVYIPDKGTSGEIRGFVIMVQDITERLQAEEQRLALERKILETQRLESIGVLTGGIAHDFNNLLTAILGNAGLALMELPAQSSARDTIDRLMQAAEQAATLTRQMLAYSGRGHFLIQPLDLNTLIIGNRSLIETSLGLGMDLHYDLAHSLPAVEADAAQIQQMLLNLVINAAEALDGRAGVIELHTSVVPAAQAGLAQFDLPPDPIAEEYVLLRVSDTGSGMDAQTRARVFDPFFSTKFTGRGLGLAAVLGIVRGHLGGLHIQSEPGRGTAMTIVLPSMRQTPQPAEVLPIDAQPTGTPAIASNIVLLIDDDPGVRAMTTRMLERLGCMVLQAADGRTAIELFQINRETIALVLLDLMMPHISGEQVLSEIKRIKPDVCVVLMSGYSKQDAAQLFDTLAPVSFLQKPFTSSELRSVLHNVIPLD